MEQFPKPISKVDEYVARVANGETIESFGDIPESWKAEILAKTQPPIPTIEQARSDIESRIRTDFENLTKEELKEQIVLRSNLEYWKRRTTLSDDLFTVGKGNSKEDASGNVITWESIDGSIGQHFNAHGIAKTEQLQSLLSLLENGIDTTRAFYSAPFEIPKEDKAGIGAGMGTGGGTAYKEGIAVVTSGYDKTLVDNGIKHVFLNDVYEDLRAPLAALYPQYQFHLLSEQKPVLESEARAMNQPS